MKLEINVLAYVISPIFPSFYVLLIQLIGNGEINYANLYLSLLSSLIVSYGSFLILGLPYISFLKRKNRLDLLSLALGGIVLGSIAYYLFNNIFAMFLGSAIGGVLQIKSFLWGRC